MRQKKRRPRKKGRKKRETRKRKEGRRKKEIRSGTVGKLKVKSMVIRKGMKMRGAKKIR